MGRLSFVGLGLGADGVTLEGVAELRGADVVYLEYYTTPHEPRLLKALEEATGRLPVVVDREFVEDGRKMLEESKSKSVVLAVPGDPMIATTHGELRARAIKSGIDVRLVHSATIAAAAASASGLQSYKFSRTVTVTRESAGRLTQAYHILHDNLLQGAHTLLLLEYDAGSGEGVSPGDAMAGLLLAEANFKRDVVKESTFVMVLSRVGRPSASFSAGELKDLKGSDFGEAPHCIVIPGRMHFTEVEEVSAVFSLSGSQARGNSDYVRRTAQTLVPRYVAKAKRALESVSGKLGPEYQPVVENAELYLRDAESFLANGEDEMAMLSVGYAEGLLDSLSFSGVVKIDW